jgi:hypothetical protein
MSELVNVQAKKQLAKILATENLTILHVGTRTATFDPVKRILTLPIWNDMDGDIYDLLVTHEVGHALYTPSGSTVLIDACTKIDPVYPMAAKSFINVVEDARVEKLVKRRYPGVRASFIRAYKKLLERNFFGTVGKDVSKMGIIDRLNLYFKVGFESGVSFSKEEMKFVKAIEDVMTFDEVVKISIDLYKYAKLEREEKKRLESQDNDLIGDSEDQKDGNNDTQSNQSAASMSEDSNVINPDAESVDISEDEQKSGEGDSSDCDSSDDKEESGDGDSGNSSEDASSDGDSESEDESEGSDGDGDKKNAKVGDGKLGKAPVEDPSPIESETDSFWNKKQDTLRDLRAKPILYLGLPTPKLDKIIVGYKKVHEDIRSFYDARQVALFNIRFEEFKRENKPVVDWLLKEFEMYKAADQYARTLTAKSGILDQKRLFEYRYSDDIMRRNEIVPGAKNHAQITLLDYSGSMSPHMIGSIHQLINLAMFQRKAQIAFRIFTFGAMTSSSTFLFHSGTSSKFNHQPGDFAFYADFSLREILSSEMNAKEFNDACVNLLMLATYLRESAQKVPRTDQLGGTPLNEAIVCAIPLVQQMYKKGAQFVSLNILTDGEATTYGHFTPDGKRLEFINFDRYRVLLHDPVTRMDYELHPDAYRTTDQFLKIFNEQTKSPSIGFFITRSKEVFNSDLHNLFPVSCKNGNKLKEVQREIDQNSYAISEEMGYNEFYIIPGGDNLKTNDDKAALKNAITTSQITNALIERGNKQRKQRILLTRYIKLISK